RVGRRNRSQGVHLTAAADAEPASLSGREAPVAGMRSDLATLFVDHGPALRPEAATLEECPVVVPGEEARLLALRPRRDRQAGLCGLGPRLRLRLLAEREPDPPEPRRLDPREHVRLVLRGI